MALRLLRRANSSSCSSFCCTLAEGAPMGPIFSESCRPYSSATCPMSWSTWAGVRGGMQE